MKTAHTPGPWFYVVSTPAQEREKDGRPNISCGANAEVFYRDSKTILFGKPASRTIVYLPHWRKDEENEEHIANAKLIAKAPTMWDSLQMILDTTSRTEPAEERLASIRAICESLLKP